MQKKTLFALAALGLAAATANAQQSSATLYGVVDINLAKSTALDGSTVTAVNSFHPTGLAGSRFGLRGTEAIGGGLSAMYQLEAGLNPESGTTTANNQLFNRHAWVGVSGGFGQLTFGRQETMHRVLNVSNYGDVAGESELSVTTNSGTTGSTLQMMQNFGTRVNNAVRYTSPTMSGVRVRVQSALGQRSTATTNGILATYDKGPLRAAVAYEYYDGSGVGGISRWNEVLTVSGQYDFGPATLALGYATTDKSAPSSTTFPTSLATLPTATAYNVGVIVPVNKDLSLRAQYTTSNTKTPAIGTAAAYSQDFSRIGVSARYSLSPRTRLYAAYTEKEVDLIPTMTAAAIATAKAAGNKNSLGVGISHAF